jgi:putative ABC transport system substrate-binding protein
MRLIGLVLPVFLALAPFAADAQQADKVARVGTLSSGSAALNEVPGEGRRVFRERLSYLGWIVGQNLTFESRYAEGNLERLPGLAAELVQLKVSMIVAFGTQPSLAAKRATATIPIVMFAGDPVGSGLIASLAHPGGNITDLTGTPR